MDVQAAHKTLNNSGHLADTPLLFLKVHSAYLPFGTLDFILTQREVFAVGIPSRTACLWESGLGDGAESPGPAPSCLFVCRRGAGFPPCVCLRLLALCQRGSPVWV